MNSNDICLISPIEQNKIVKCWDNSFHKRYFEDEAIRMVEQWRKHAGWLKDINIYFMNVNGAKIDDETFLRLKKMGCQFIDEKTSQYEDIGFLTEPKTGLIAEQNLKERFFIKTDLDMVIARPLDSSLFELASSSTLIEQYTDVDAKSQRSSIGDFNPFDTCFIVSTKDSGFYTKYHELCYSDVIRKNPSWMKIESENGLYYLEEFVVDYMFKNHIVDITPMNNHIYGEGYKTIETRTDNEINQIRFLHSHIYKDSPPKDGYSQQQQQQQYMKRLCRILLKNKC